MLVNPIAFLFIINMCSLIKWLCKKIRNNNDIFDVLMVKESRGNDRPKSELGWTIEKEDNKIKR